MSNHDIFDRNSNINFNLNIIHSVHILKKSYHLQRQRSQFQHSKLAGVFRTEASEKIRAAHRIEALNARREWHKERCYDDFLEELTPMAFQQTRTKQRGRKLAATAPQPPCRSNKSTPRAYGRQINICSSPPLHTDKLGCKVRRVGIRRRRDRIAKSGKAEEGEEENSRHLLCAVGRTEDRRQTELTQC